jgi:hypothetical protein
MTQKRYGKSTKKPPDAQVINGTPFHAKAEKSLASNASAATNTHKDDPYSAVNLDLKKTTKTTEVKLVFHLRPTKSPFSI